MVYAEGALCRRRATVPVPPGGRLRLTGLPTTLDGRSLRARVIAGPAGTAVTEARLEPRAQLRTPDELPDLQRALDEATERLSALTERRRLVLAAIADTAALRAVPPQRRRDEPLRRTPADAWLELADFVDERLAALQERAEELNREVELADHERDLAADRLDRASTADRAEPIATSATALLTLTTPDLGPTTLDSDTAPELELELELEYGVPAARWVPSYRLSHRSGSDTGRLVLRAGVAQRTGEDWTGVRLALSTADLDRRTDLPRLASLRIGRSQPAPPPSGWREPPAGLSDLFTGYESAAADRPAPHGEGRHPVPVSAGIAPRAAHRAGARPTGPRPEFFSAQESTPPGPSGPYGGGTLNVDEPPSAAAPPPAPGGFAGYGGPPPTTFAATAPTAPAAPLPQAPGGLRARRTASYAGQAGQAGHPGHAALPAPPPPPGLAPNATLLDYPDLVLAGPDEPPARRGTLHPRPERLEREELDRVLPGGNPGEQVRRLPLPRHAVPPRESAGSFDHRFDAVAPADIPSDGTWHTVTVDEIPLAVLPEYVTVPAVEEKVYATLVLANRTDRAVLAGPVEVTVDDEFLLTAALPTLAPGGTRRLGIGVTESIEVARRTELRESTTGMLKGNSTVLDHRVHVELANRLGRPVTVEVRERVPVTSDAEIRIEERADWHAPAVPTPECPTGTRLWRVDLPPGGRTELDGGYLIKIPAGKAIVGGNRRN
ncbi:uncharacterized protein (TIGR02231 family) [Streptomyces sp. 1114.5]|uniref:DUF4139 domain-containing protein n=1 Tax=Streptomyces sp. 1114.5 TaxID=1938830 RepID=UPI000F0E5B20|nr:DUF4139 domain-containing protein [Streptomyces sp. 1114.5]RKT11269.1 uncharacterized protein (TIGR02231 family) [Streptomyces sp. 1114.5]